RLLCENCSVCPPFCLMLINCIIGGCNRSGETVGRFAACHCSKVAAFDETIPFGYTRRLSSSAIIVVRGALLEVRRQSSVGMVNTTRRTSSSGTYAPNSHEWGYLAMLDHR